MKIQNSNKQYETILSIVIILLLAYVVSSNSVFVYISAGIGFISLISKSFTLLLNKVWGFILKMVGFVNAHIILSLIFGLVLIPISFIYRLLNKDTLNLADGKKSYFSDRNHTYEATDLKNMW